MTIFLTILPRVIFRTQPKTYGGAFLEKNFKFFRKKAPPQIIECAPKTPPLPLKTNETNYCTIF